MLSVVYVVAYGCKKVWRVCVVGDLRVIDSRVRSIALSIIARDSRHRVLELSVGLRPGPREINILCSVGLRPALREITSRFVARVGDPCYIT